MEVVLKIQSIEKNVPIPKVHSKINYPWPEMEVGDAVFIQPDKDQTLFQLKRMVGPAARYYGAVTDKKFKALMIREENGVRVWRIE